ncbi:MAG: MurR/RpiR family transcriptional regulator [Firmicutes bacterium]|nr:MurR/RpiR family transcriptional regulator [Bacillota bacterium]
MNTQIYKRIKEADLTKTETKIAEYISRHTTGVCFMSAIKLAEIIGTSDTSVIRTARKLGFSGFSDMQTFLSNPIRDELERNEGINFLSPAAQVDKKINQIQASDLYDQMLKKINNNIVEIFERNTTKTFEEAGKIICSSKKKFVMGFHGCTAVANLLGGSLGDVFEDVRTVTTADSKAIGAIMDIDEKDCLIVISFPRYAEMACIVIEIASKKNAKVIVLTDRLTSPISKMSDISLLCGIDSVTINNSYVAPTVVAEMLLATVYKNIEQKEKKRLEELDYYITKHCLY